MVEARRRTDGGEMKTTKRGCYREMMSSSEIGVPKMMAFKAPRRIVWEEKNNRAKKR